MIELNNFEIILIISFFVGILYFLLKPLLKSGNFELDSDFLDFTDFDIGD